MRISLRLLVFVSVTHTLASNATTAPAGNTTSPGSNTTASSTNAPEGNTTASSTNAPEGNTTSSSTNAPEGNTTASSGISTTSPSSSITTTARPTTIANSTATTPVPTTVPTQQITIVFADVLSDAQKTTLISILANLTGLPISSFSIVSGRKRNSAVVISISGSTSNSAALEIVATLNSNPEYLTQRDGSMPRVESAEVSSSSPRESGISSTVIIVIAVVFGLIALAILATILVVMARKRQGIVRESNSIPLRLNQSFNGSSGT